MICIFCLNIVDTPLKGETPGKRKTFDYTSKTLHLQKSSWTVVTGLTP